VNEPKRHACSIRSAEAGYGNAIDDCTENEKGEFWVGNGEYGSQVNFCPICGAKAPVPVPADKFQIGQPPEEKPFIRVWPFHDAPEALRALSDHGGDEDWLALIPAELVDAHDYRWMKEGSEFGVCDVSSHELADGAEVRIGTHS
jgi:hypothetical protein